MASKLGKVLTYRNRRPTLKPQKPLVTRPLKHFDLHF